MWLFFLPLRQEKMLPMKSQHSSLTSGLESVRRRQAKMHIRGLPSAVGGAVMTDDGLVLCLGSLLLFAHQGENKT